MLDYMEEIERVDTRIKEYSSTGNRWIFKHYFDLTERLDSSEMCTLVDSYQIGQSGSKFGSHANFRLQHELQGAAE